MKQVLLLLLLLTVFVTVGSAQKAHDLREKYGVPDNKGRYRVRPKIGMKVEPSEDGRPAKMVIQRLDMDEPPRPHTPKVMLTAEAEEVLAEVVPIIQRGKLRSTSAFAFGCTGFQTSEYDQVTITLDTRCEAQGGGTYHAIVHWKWLWGFGKPTMNNKQLIVKILGLAAMLLLSGLSLKVTAQTPQEFKERYGPPQSGIYTVRAGIGARIAFDAANQAAEIDVAPLRSDAPLSAMSATEAAKILDEIMPVSQRGKILKKAGFVASCVSVQTEDYERVSIAWTIRCESQGGGVYRLNIRRK
jgi:hypothetical protein